MESKKYDFGTITHYINEEICNSVVRIQGIAKSTPHFINKVDEELWKDNWDTQSKELGVTYIHRQDRFDKDGPWHGLSQADIDDCEAYMPTLLESYNVEAERYNKEIAEPFVEERRTLLNKIFDNKQ